ncbi:unknown [Clostridium sp. CAG:967]|nr:unknown [Clostridium sp. CAG:967]
MLKKILLTLIIFTGLAAYAGENFLNTVVLENNDGAYSIVLRSDEVAKVKKDVEAPDKIVLTLKGISQSPDVNTLYKNTPEVSGLVIQNSGNNEVKIFINAPDISKANIIFETPNSAPILVGEAFEEEKIVWSVISIALLLLVMRSARSISAEPEQKDINKVIKEREIALYRNFQKEVASMPSMNYKLKSYKKHVLKGETIRNYESKLTRV